MSHLGQDHRGQGSQGGHLPRTLAPVPAVVGGRMARCGHLPSYSEDVHPVVHGVGLDLELDSVAFVDTELCGKALDRRYVMM